jgi:hypothetical protein
VSIDDVIQMGDFIEHAQFHNEQYGDDFFTFVSKHYGELKTQHEEQHKEEHEELPFQNNSIFTTVIGILDPTAATDLKAITLVDYSTHHFYYQDLSSTKHLYGLLQPPQIS